MDKQGYRGNRFVGRPKSSNKMEILGVRILNNQRESLDRYAKQFGMTKSEIIREAITMWVNVNSKGA